MSRLFTSHLPGGIVCGVIDVESRLRVIATCCDSELLHEALADEEYLQKTVRVALERRIKKLEKSK